MKIYYNPKCSKCRIALNAIGDREVEIIEYLKEPLSEKELEELLNKLNLTVEDIIRKNEKLFKENFKDEKFTESEWIKILFENPILIQRPIIVKGNKAVIARSEEMIQKILSN